MAHHSPDVDPEMEEKRREQLQGLRDLLQESTAQETEIRRKQQVLGATGQFPEGQLTEADEGEIRFGVTAVDGKVVLDFGTPVTWMGMTPEQAKDLGQLLVERAASVEAPAQSEKNPPPDSDFCGKCHEHADFEQDELGEWLSVCCSVRAVEME